MFLETSSYLSNYPTTSGSNDSDIGFDEAQEVSERDALTRGEIEELSSCVDFQSHTVSHPVLPKCSNEKAEYKIFASKQDIEREYGFDVYALSYPNGDYSDREISLAKSAGYQCAVTADAGFNSDQTDPFRLKRINIDDNDGIDKLVVKACGLWGLIKGALRQKAFGYTPTPGPET